MHVPAKNLTLRQNVPQRRKHTINIYTNAQQRRVRHAHTRAQNVKQTTAGVRFYKRQEVEKRGNNRLLNSVLRLDAYAEFYDPVNSWLPRNNCCYYDYFENAPVSNLFLVA